MFRAIHKKSRQRLYTLGDQATPLWELVKLANKDLLICENCGEPVLVKRDRYRIWHFLHHQPEMTTPYCRLRFLSFRKLLRYQIGTDPRLRAYKEIDLIETDEYFQIPDEVRKFIASASKRYFPPPSEPFIFPKHFVCDVCGDIKQKWTVLEVDTLRGKCSECMERIHEEELCKERQLTKISHTR